MVKLEGGAPLLETVRRLTANGVPVCAHLGLLPQSIHRLGAYRYQGRDAASALAILEDAVALQDASAGNGCDGQVLVLHDLLGLNPRGAPRFSKDFLAGRGGLSAAIAAYVEDVRAGTFPDPEHTAF